MRTGRPMTREEINEMVRVKQSNLTWIEEHIGIWSYEFRSANDELKRWRRIQAGQEIVPMVMKEGE